MTYKLYAWRKHMNVGYQEMTQTPASIIIQDLDMINLENQYSQPKE